ncbi:MAG: HAD hydrolase-like protein [Candidatus Cloacimonetes bacterium]|jgi:phosphoglycolate phosphatase|nr:HAD hydrolase-like protein [Candidatus Cloacimonadota bacterium]NLO43585.1 HAD hydrolase-like protein [Candidatus Cloacimonadota bacterium]
MKAPFILFDFDGTIADSIHYALDIVNAFAPEYGIEPLNEEQFEMVRSMHMHKAMKILKFPVYKLPGAVTRVLLEYRKKVHELQPYDGVREMLTELKEMGCKMAVLSSNTKENLDYFINHHELHYFDWAEGTSGTLNKQKRIKAQMKNHGIDKDQIIYVGDEIRDISAAKKSGIRVIAVTWGFHTSDLLVRKDPDYLVSHPSEIVEIVKSILA